MARIINQQYRVVGIVETSGFRTEREPVTRWFDAYDKAAKAKRELEVEQEKGRQRGFGYFIGYYKIETQRMVADYID